MLNYKHVKNGPLYQWRQRNQYTMEKAAEVLGVTHQGYRYWEKGQEMPSLPNLLKLQEIAGVQWRDYLAWYDGK